MIRTVRVLTCAGVLAVGATAHADELGPGEKGVSLSIRVDAEVPAGKGLILANTFRGADKVWTGQVTAVSWHPMSGDMQLYLVDAAEREKLGGLGREEAAAVVAAGKACGGAFPGIRTIPDTSPASEVRWTLRATISGDGCSAQLVGLEYLDANGKAVDPGPVDRKPITPPDLKAADATKAAPAEPVKAAAPPETKGGCDVQGGRGGPWGLLAVFVIVRAGARRRRTSSPGR